MHSFRFALTFKYFIKGRYQLPLNYSTLDRLRACFFPPLEQILYSAKPCRFRQPLQHLFLNKLGSELGNTVLPFPLSLNYRALALTFSWNSAIGSGRKAEIRVKKV